MCGRYTIKARPEEIAAAFGLSPAPRLEPRYNVAPTQGVPAVRLDGQDGGRRLDLMRWGLVPGWADDPAIGNRMINARAETVAEKPSYRTAFKARRCLMVADGFYEWQKLGGKKQPYYIRRTDGRPFAFAGIWEYWERDGVSFESCCLITTTPNELVEPIHDRMPVILPADAYDFWLDPAVTDAVSLVGLLQPYPTTLMEAWPVGSLVNAPANDRPACLEQPSGEERRLF